MKLEVEAVGRLCVLDVFPCPITAGQQLKS